MGAFGLKTHIWNNNLASIFLLAMFPVLLLLIAYALTLLFTAGSYADTGTAMREAMYQMPVIAPFAVAAAGIWFGIAWMGHSAMIDAAVGAKSLTRQDNPQLYNMLENLCVSRGMPMPRLKIVETDAMNAFATGLSDKRASITFTRGLLDRLNRDEVEAVMAHELTHVRNKDIRLLVIAIIFVGIISFVGEMLVRGMFYSSMGRRGGGRRGGGQRGGGKGGGAVILIAIAIMVVAYTLAILIRFAMSRRREYLADAGAVELTKNPDAMITALRKISGSAPVQNAPGMVREMFLHHPKADFMDMFATHPPIEKRIAALVQYAGGRDPGPGAPPPAAASQDDGPWGARPAGPWG